MIKKETAKKNLERDLKALNKAKQNNENKMRINFLETSIECWKMTLGGTYGQ